MALPQFTTGTIAEPLVMNAMVNDINANSSAIGQKANLLSPNFTGVPKIDNVIIATSEKGVFTPILSGSIISGANIYLEQFGSYEKIDKLVTFTTALRLSQKDANMSGTEVNIAGLPFITSHSDARSSCTIGFMQNVNLANETKGVGGYLRGGSNRITLAQFAQGASALILTPSEITNTSGIYVSGSYFID